MPTRGEWALLGIIIGAIAFVGVALYLTRKPAAQGLQLKRVASQGQLEPKVIIQNEERAELERDSEGNLMAIVIHRKVIE